ncbi:MAG: 2-amino-4-hydroxy-6-hydroxymethyldihydropteridine diphosphokinase [Natronospirillum sp.]
MPGTEVLLSLGSNVDREYHLSTALTALADAYGAMDVSPVYESAAVGFDGEAFFNLVVAIWTTESLPALNLHLKQIEDDCGRDRSQPKFSDRTLDIDVLTFGTLNGMVEGIRLPRYEVYKNAYVLKPLADIRPNQPVPGDVEHTWSTLWALFPHEKQPLRVVDIGWISPEN